MLESSVTVGRVAGIRIGIHYTWVVIFALLLFSLSFVFGEQNPQWGQTEVIGAAFAATILFFISIILHELGHSLVAIARGIPVQSITLFIFGGVAQSEEEAENARDEFAIAIAGPLVSFALAALFYMLSLPAQAVSELAATALAWLATINLVVGIFNLVPGFPLDGGRVLRALVWGGTGDPVKGMRWAVTSGRIVAFGLMLLGVAVAFGTGLFINGFWLVAIGWFLLSAAEASGTQFTLTRLLRGVSVEQLMQYDVPQVSADMSLADWMDQRVLTSGQRAYLVTEGIDGERVAGLVTLSDSKKVPRERWAATPVRAAMTPRAQLRTVKSDAPALEVLRTLERDALNQVPVTDAGEVVGWIDRDQFMRILRRHVEAGR